MKQYDSEKEVYWEVNFFDTTGKLIDFFGNTENKEQIEILKEKAIKQGYDSFEVVEVTRKTTRYHI